MKRTVKLKDVFDCGDGAHQVLTLDASQEQKHLHRRTPCEQCPWRSDLPTGVFPVEAFRHSATTAYDMAQNTFACHMSGKEKPTTCAGFLLRGAKDNLAMRLAILWDRYDPRSVSSDVPLYDGYRSMAIANGVDANDPVLAPCRGEDEDWQQLISPHERKTRP